MIRSYSTPGPFKAALDARLRNQATRDRADLQRLRQLMVFDRFLARLFLDDQHDVVLKCQRSPETVEFCTTAGTGTAWPFRGHPDHPAHPTG